MKTPVKKLFMIAAGLALVFTAHHAQARAKGMDVSHYQGSVNWNSAYNNSAIRFGFAKCTEGDYFIDPNFSSNMSNGKNAGCIMGGYHFARPDINDGTHEANYYWTTVGGHIFNGGLSFLPVLDLEVWGSGHVGATSLTDWANQWGSQVTTKMHNDGHTGGWIVYGSACNVCGYNNNINGRPWIANYNGQDPDTGTPWNVCSSCNVWGTWRIWQYTSTGSVSGVSGNCDRDVYNGTLAELQGSNLIVQKYP